MSRIEGQLNEVMSLLKSREVPSKGSEGPPGGKRSRCEANEGDSGENEERGEAAVAS